MDYKDKKVLDYLTKYGYKLKNIPIMKKSIAKIKKRDPWVYHFYLNETVEKELRKRYKGTDKRIISGIKILIIREKYGLEIPHYMWVILESRGELNGN